MGTEGGVGWELSYKDTSDGEGNVIYDIRLLKTYARRSTIIIGMLPEKCMYLALRCQVVFFFFISILSVGKCLSLRKEVAMSDHLAI